MKLETGTGYVKIENDNYDITIYRTFVIVKRTTEPTPTISKGEILKKDKLLWIHTCGDLRVES